MPRTVSGSPGRVAVPVASLLMCHGQNTAWTIVNGQVVADHGQLTTVDVGPLVERHNQLAGELAGN